MAIHHFANVKNISVADCMIISGHKEPRTLLRIYAQSRPKEVANKLNKCKWTPANGRLSTFLYVPFENKRI